MTRETVYFFSDETGSNTRGRYFLVAGFASSRYRLWTRDDLLHVERVSMKNKRAWNETKVLAQRTRYIRDVLRIQHLQSRLFYATYRDNGRQTWTCTADAICLAVKRFAPNGHAIIKHQGFEYGAREKLRESLDPLGISYEIQPANQLKHAEIRLADALCGYLRTCQDGTPEMADRFDPPPEWLVDLKNEAPSSRD